MDNDYDPHEHREINRAVNNFEAFMIMLKGILGSGLVALPVAYKHAGWVIGTIGLLLCALITINTCNILIATEYNICKRKRVSLLQYPSAMEAVAEMGPPCGTKCGKFFWYSTFFLLIIVQLGACATYIAFGAGVLESFVNGFLPNDDRPFKKIHFILITMAPYFLTLFVLNLKVVAPISCAANIALITGIILCFRYLFVDLDNLTDNRRTVGPLTEIPIFIGIAIFSMQAIGVVTHVEYNMKNPENFGGLCGVFSLSMSAVFVIYFVTAFFGYWKFGNEVKGNFVLNLPLKEVIPRILNVLLFLSMWISYGLNMLVPVDMIWEKFMKEKFNEKTPFWWHFLIRCSLFTITYGFVIAVPNMGLLTKFMGATGMATLGIIYPGIMELFERYESGYGKFKWILIKDIIIIIIGIASIGFGVYSGVLDAIEHRTDD